MDMNVLITKLRVAIQREEDWFSMEVKRASELDTQQAQLEYVLELVSRLDEKRAERQNLMYNNDEREQKLQERFDDLNNKRW